MGATPIDITAQDAYLAFQRKSIDAYINTWSSVAANKYGEVASHFTSANLFNSVFFAVMNKSVYDALPDDQRAVIDANSTAEAFNAATDTYWDDEAEAMRKVQEQSGGKAQITEWSAGEKAKFRDLVAPAWDDWESRVSATGKPAGELAAYLRSLA